MKYLCLVYSDERLLHSLPESPKDEECMAYAESIQGSGRMVAAEALESVQTATTAVSYTHLTLPTNREV